MARILGIDLPRDKRIEVGLTYIYGIGPVRAKKILTLTKVNPDTRVKDLTDEQVSSLINALQNSGFKLEGDLRRDVQQNIKRLMDISSYRGMRHIRSLPVRGQRTHTNARTRKGRRPGVGRAKK